jgi:LuxR family maltose regulon positive regulatory protein
MGLKQSDSEDKGRGSQSEVLAAGWYGVPPVPDRYVRRPRLLALLAGADSCPVVLVSAPAGSGKSSLVADWVGSRSPSTGTEWVTFESDDAEFWPGVMGGLARLGVALPSGSVPRGTSVLDHRWLTALCATLAGQPSRLTLVLDGYELVSREVADDLDFLLRHSGHRVQVVLVTRVDPVLPLYRYRLEGSIAEVRMADLAFTDAETAELLGAANVHLRPESVHALNLRTEGWVAGLRFASRFLETSVDPDRAVADVVGDSGNIGEYLMGEVLAAQTPEVRELLLNTSVPETLQPGLAEALGGRSAARTLAFLTRVNAFVEPVPHHPGFYRYHRFFRDLLRAELAYEDPNQLERLQRRAAEWFAREGLLTASVSHYAAIDAWAEAAAEVVDGLAVGELLLDGSDGALSRTFRPMPREVQGSAASIVRATMALAGGDTFRFNHELAQLPDPVEQESDAHVRAVSLGAAVLRAVRARYSDDPDEAIELAEVAEQHLREGSRNTRVENRPENHRELLALVYASKGIATLNRGRLDAAHHIFTAGAGAATGLGAEALLIECLGSLALIACVRDELSHARALAGRAVAIADDLGIPPDDRPPAAQVALAWVAVERYEQVVAAEHLRLADRSDFITGDPVPRTVQVIVGSRVLAAHGDLTGARAVVDGAVAGFVDQGSWLVERLRLEAGHLAIANQDPGAAVLAVQGLQNRLPAEVGLVVARARLLEGDEQAVREALSSVLVPGTPLSAWVRGWLVECARQQQRGASTKARSALHHALKAAAHESLRRPFYEAPLPVADALVGNPQLRTTSAWLNFATQHSAADGSAPNTKHPQSRLPTTGEELVIEPLTPKELEVLGHLAELLSTEEIAAAMSVSVNTVRTHVRSILRKFGVSRRNAAVRRARELQLLPA